MFTRSAPSSLESVPKPGMTPNGDAPTNVGTEPKHEHRGERRRSQFNNEKLEELYLTFAEHEKVSVNSSNGRHPDSTPMDNNGTIPKEELSEPNTKKTIRMAVVRYFLDRPGYDLRHSAARLWFHPPAICTPQDVREFLTAQNIGLRGLLVEIYLDKFDSFMMLDAIEAGFMEWDFSDATPAHPAILNVRLTDIEQTDQPDVNMISVETGRDSSHSVASKTPSSSPTLVSAAPIGLFAFSMITGLEAAAFTNRVVSGSFEDSFALMWGPYGFFVGGLLQLLVGIFEIFRNNIYGAVAFSSFGCFWLSNGLSIILQTHFSAEGTFAYELVQAGSDPWFHFVRCTFILAFCCALEVQTWTMNKLSSALVGLLCIKLVFHAVTPWSLAAEWLDFILGWMLACLAFYVFFVEFTNQVYQREVFPMYKWSEENSPSEVFGAAGRTGTLHSKALRLRQANYVRMQAGHLREVPPVTGGGESKKKVV